MSSTLTDKPSICIVSHMAYSIVARRPHPRGGGVEWQTTLTARWLAEHGYPVSMITWREDDGPAEEVLDGIRVIKLCRPNEGIPLLRFFHPRWSSLARALSQANAEVYYHNCAEEVTGQIARWCRRHKRKFVYSVANDPDVDSCLPDMKTMHERILYRYGLRNSHRIIVQTYRQKKKLWEGFALNSSIIPMPCIGLPEKQYLRNCQDVERRYQPVNWIGRIASTQKRIDRFLEVVTRCPEIPFRLIGPWNDNAFCQDMKKRFSELKNVQLTGTLSREQVMEAHIDSSCLCCTSDIEGFPNTFLESWSCGCPIVSSFDPDDVIAQHGIGVIARTAEQIADALKQITRDAQQWTVYSQAARKYYQENHDSEVVLLRFEREFLEVTGRLPGTKECVD